MKTKKTKEPEIKTDPINLLFYFLWNAFKHEMRRGRKVYVKKDSFHVKDITEVTEDMMLTLRCLDGLKRTHKVRQGSFIVTVVPGPDESLTPGGPFEELLYEWDLLQDKMKPVAEPRASTPKKRRG